MPIIFKCECGKVLKAREGTEGQQGRCPVCQREFTVPTATEAKAAEVAPPAPAPPEPEPPAPEAPAEQAPAPEPSTYHPKVEPTCPACGEPVAAEAVFCGKCGYSLRPRAAAAAPAPAPAAPAPPPAAPAPPPPAARPPVPSAPPSPPPAMGRPAPPPAVPAPVSAPSAPAYGPAPSAPPAAPFPQPAPWQAAPSAAAPAADEYQGARTRGILLLGIILLLACALPMLIPGEDKTQVVFTNFVLLGEGDVPFLGKLLLLLPGIAGLAAIVLAFAMRNVVRSLILTALGIAAFVLPLLDEKASQVPGLVVLLGPDVRIALVCAFLGTAVLYAGCRSRCFRPWSRAAAIIGAIGGAVYIVSLVLPETSGGDIGIVRQFKMLDTRKECVEGIVQLVATALAVVASVLCFINIPLAPKGQKVGRLAFWLLFVSLLLGYYGMVFVTGLQGGEAPAEHIPAILVAALKMASWALGTVLLVAVGLADLIVNVSRGGAPAGAGAASAGAFGGPPGYGVRPQAPPAYGGAPAAPQDDTSARLQRLRELLNRGLISIEEYEQKKNEILSRM